MAGEDGMVDVFNGSVRVGIAGKKRKGVAVNFEVRREIRRARQNQIKLMRKMGAPIEYNRRAKKYYFTENKNLNFKYE